VLVRRMSETDAAQAKFSESSTAKPNSVSASAGTPAPNRVMQKVPPAGRSVRDLVREPLVNANANENGM